MRMTEIKEYSTPSIFLSGTKIKFSDKVRYLEILLNRYLLDDDDDVKRQARSRFVKCSSSIKNTLFRSYCTRIYCCHLWHNYTQYTFNRMSGGYMRGGYMRGGYMRGGYNDGYRIFT